MGWNINKLTCTELISCFKRYIHSKFLTRKKKLNKVKEIPLQEKGLNMNTRSIDGHDHRRMDPTGSSRMCFRRRPRHRVFGMPSARSQRFSCSCSPAGLIEPMLAPPRTSVVGTLAPPAPTHRHDDQYHRSAKKKGTPKPFKRKFQLPFTSKIIYLHAKSDDICKSG